MQRALLAFTALALSSTLACTIGVPLDQRKPGNTQHGPGGTEGEGEGAGHEGEGEGQPQAKLDITKSTIASDPATSQPADGIAAFNITAHLVDTNGNPMPNVAVDFASSLGTFAGSTVNTSATGDAVVALSSTTPGDAQITASIGSDQLTLTVNFAGCRTVQQAYEQELYPKVFSRCQGCHNELGLAHKEGVYELPFPGVDNWAQRSIDALTPEAVLTETAIDGTTTLSKLVGKPTEQLPEGHGGGQVVTPGSEEERLLTGFAALLVNGTSCTGVDDPAQAALDHISVASPRETFARAKLALTGQVATPEEVAAMPDTEQALDAQIDTLLASPQFLTRVTDWYADWFLTDQWTKQMGGTRILNRNNQWKERFYFSTATTGVQQCDPTKETCCDQDHPSDAATYCTSAQNDNLVNTLAREPLKLITTTIANDEPISNAITADHTVVNPLSAVFYGFTTTERAALFNSDPTDDANEFVTATIHKTANNTLGGTNFNGNYPHAGVVTTHSMLARWPTTTSNKNRGRARSIVMARLMDIDVMKFAEFSTATLPPDADLEQATQQYVACTACHSAIDPIAGLFARYSNFGTFTKNPVASNLQDMPTPGFIDATPNAGDDGVQFLASQVIGHERFPIAMLLPVLNGLTGFTELDQNVDPNDPDADSKALALAIQHRVIADLRDQFVQGGLVVRPLVKSIVEGPLFRAKSVDSLSDQEKKALQVAGIGRGIMITPEQLDRKLSSIFGFDYHANRSPTGTQLLLDVNQYRILWGGINYNAISTRFRDPSPVLTRIVERMGTEMACTAVPQEFATTNAANRKLFTLIEDTDTSDTNVRAQIKRLHALLLNETVNDGDAELEATVSVFNDVLSTGQGLIASGTATAALPADCKATKSFDAAGTPYPTTGKVQVTNDPNYVIRAWMAVVSYMLQDPRFFTE